LLLRNLTATAVLSAVLLACQDTQSNSGGPLVDDAGRAVSLDATPTRIVSLAPGMTELLFAIGAGERVVGRTRWCDYPPAATGIPSVGDGLSPNVESIMARRPDLVVFYASPANETAISQLEHLGVATLSLLTDDLEDLMRSARLLGRVTGDSAIADSLSDWLDREITLLERTRPVWEDASVLLVAWDNPPIVIGGSSFLSEMVEIAGARNSFGDVERPSLTVSIETIAERDPDLVLAASDSGVPAWAGRPEWRAVAAVRDKRFVVVHGSEFSRPSFRAPQAIRSLRVALKDWLER
jgi:iron complex transport system substrate-binding protein